VDIIENTEEWRKRYNDWKQQHQAATANGDLPSTYPFVKNKRAPFTPARRALPMLNLGLISSAGAYIKDTDPFDTSAVEGDFSFREIPSEIEPEDLAFAARGYNPAGVIADPNAELPLDRLFEFEANGIIGQVNAVFWSFNGFILNAARFVDETVPNMVERVKRCEVQAALLVPASRLCHQSVSLLARAIEQTGIPTMTLGVDRDLMEMVRPPRGAFYEGDFGIVAGQPEWPEHQRRVLDEALRLIEPMDQAAIRNLTANLETEVERQRGEK
jgi:D-proline reductase (dithiol) PrdB